MTPFEQIERDVAVFARRAIRRGACPCCLMLAMTLECTGIADRHGLADELEAMLRSTLETKPQPIDVAH